MDSENALRIAVVVAAIAEAVAGALLVYIAVKPVIVFRGSVTGRVSLVAYSVTVLGQPIESQIFDYISQLSVLLFLATGFAATFSAAALASLWKRGLRRIAIPGLFASSLSLVIGFSLAQALLRLASLEASHIQVRSIRTSAGLISFPEEKIIYTSIYWLAKSPWLLVPVLVAVVASGYALYLLPEEEAR